MNEPQIKDIINVELKRMAWRLQYYSRKAAKQYPFTFDFTRQESFEDEIIDELNVEYILNLIDNDSGRKIIHSLYVEDKSTREVSEEMNISVQGVNKWKRKTLEALRKKISSNYSTKLKLEKTMRS
ncbi:RNA polymerase sigma factor [Paenibacillus sp. TC-CSREp1]|uniref:RNA polymerase sigma factor n=1 Tax=Paenibacillus sp. TC-CSREp1 TaxID=3410089 RepID=UPI003D043B65